MNAVERIYETIISNGRERFVFYAYNDLGSAEAKRHALTCWIQCNMGAQWIMVRHRAVAVDGPNGVHNVAPDVALEDFVIQAGHFISMGEL